MILEQLVVMPQETSVSWITVPKARPPIRSIHPAWRVAIVPPHARGAESFWITFFVTHLERVAGGTWTFPEWMPVGSAHRSVGAWLRPDALDAFIAGDTTVLSGTLTTLPLHDVVPLEEMARRGLTRYRNVLAAGGVGRLSWFTVVSK